MGALALLNKPSGFTESDERLATLIAGQAGRSIKVRRNRDEAEQRERLAAIGQMLSGVVHDFRTPLTVISGYTELMATEADEQQRLSVRGGGGQAVRAPERDDARDAGLRPRGARAAHPQGLPPEVRQRDRGLPPAGVQEEPRPALGASRATPARRASTRASCGGWCSTSRATRWRRCPAAATSSSASTARRTTWCSASRTTAPGSPRRSPTGSSIRSPPPGVPRGPGSGLSIVKQIADEHGGSVTVESEPGKGTRFEFKIPVGLAADCRAVVAWRPEPGADLSRPEALDADALAPSMLAGDQGDGPPGQVELPGQQLDDRLVRRALDRRRADPHLERSVADPPTPGRDARGFARTASSTPPGTSRSGSATACPPSWGRGTRRCRPRAPVPRCPAGRPPRAASGDRTPASAARPRSGPAAA